MKRILKLVMAISLIFCMVFTSVMPAFAASKTYYVTANSGLNVRSGAGTGYRKVSFYSYGTKVTSTQQKNGWHKTSKGWVSSDYLSTKNPKPAKSQKPAQTANNVKTTYYVTASSLNVRSGAGTGYRKVSSYKYGTKVESTQKKNGWYKTSKGWVSGDYLSTKNPKASSASKKPSTSTGASSTGSYVKSVSGVRVTAYCAGRCCNGSWSSGSSTATASGIRLYNSSSYANKYCAATSSVGRLGQKIKMTIAGKTYTLKIVDRLGSSSGKKVDFFVPSHAQCRKFGVRSSVSGKIYK